ncbi:hypothetical protein N0V90_008815 [Kalmusia sp. IMI 367209]|nr:hypothetical protein N0V90_008815 [Kalmusia sp. IMI 367209]
MAPETGGLAGASAGDRRSLFYLPDELVVQIVGHLTGDQHTLCALARTSRFLQIESEKRIYTTIELLSTSHLRAIIEAFTNRPERIASVETLKILYRFHNGLGATAEERGVFNQCVARMKALRNWHIESPYDNFKWNRGGDKWVLGDMEEFRKALETASLQTEKGILSARPDVGLSKLERLVIHTHGVQDDFWHLGDFRCLFHHPSLRYLHVSCVLLPPDLPELEPYAKSTPLTSLVFDECELEPKSLGRILATPKQLKHLVLGENVYNIKRRRGTQPRLTMAPEAALEALMHVAHSLESLTHYDPYWRLHRDSHKHRPMAGNGMRDFHNLKTLQVDACSFLHRSIIFSHTQAPPNLATLQIRNARRSQPHMVMPVDTPDDFFEHLPPFEPYTYLKSLESLDFIQGASPEMQIVRPEHICEPENIRKRHTYAHKLFKHSINLRMYLEGTWRAGLIPPYLHGEPQPELVCVYDAAQIGFRRHIENDQRLQPSPFRLFSMTAGSRQVPDSPLTEAALRQREHAKDDASESLPAGKRVRLEEPPETDQLSHSDIHRLTNQVRRSLDQLWDRMEEAEESDSELDIHHHIFATHNILVIDDTDVDDEWVGGSDDDDDVEWHDAAEFEIDHGDDLEPDLDDVEDEHIEGWYGGPLATVEVQAQALIAAFEQAAHEEGRRCGRRAH